MAITAREGRYLAAYVQAHNLRPQLKSLTLYYFTDSSGREVSASMLTMKDEYDKAMAEIKLSKKRGIIK